MKRIFRFLFSLLIFISSFGVFFTNKLMYMKKKDEEFILKREQEAGHLKPTDHKKEVFLPSPFGYELKIMLINPHASNRYMIFAHGVTENKINSLKYSNLFLERGFNTVVYDHRRHGESGGKTTSYGYYEKHDLKTVVNWLKQEYGSHIVLGIHGESMGAATMLQYAGILEDGADFYIADCPFSDFKEQLALRLKKDFHLPSTPILPITDFFLRLRQQYSLKDVSPIAVIDHIQKPILFIHSAEDDYIPASMTRALYEKKTGPKRLFIAEKGGHAQSYLENKEEYEKVVDEFLSSDVFSV